MSLFTEEVLKYKLLHCVSRGKFIYNHKQRHVKLPGNSIPKILAKVTHNLFVAHNLGKYCMNCRS